MSDYYYCKVKIPTFAIEPFEKTPMIKFIDECPKEIRQKTAKGCRYGKWLAMVKPQMELDLT